jgi:hypothetical protein
LGTPPFIGGPELDHYVGLAREAYPGTGNIRWSEHAVRRQDDAMARLDEPSDGHRRPRPRPPLPERVADEIEDEEGMTQVELIEALRAVDGLVDVTGGHGARPNFHLRHKPFLHFHTDPDAGGLYADVKLGGPAADFEPIWASTPAEREDLLRRVRRHVRRASRR